MCCDVFLAIETGCELNNNATIITKLLIGGGWQDYFSSYREILQKTNPTMGSK